MDDRDAGRARFDPRSARGHYESWFVRANHPTRPLALWFRYTIFAPRGDASRATAELWGAWFDGDRGAHVADRIDVPLAASSFASNEGAAALDLSVGEARLSLDRATGALPALRWTLALTGGDGPQLLLPERLYRGPFPRAKSLVLRANARFDGEVFVRGERHVIDGWAGSVSHNWGAAHTDAYAWGQVMGFDGAPDSWLECVTGDVKFARLSLPRSTLAVVRHDGRTHAFTSPARGAFAPAKYDVGRWSFRCENVDATLDARFSAPREAFLGLGYRNPPGGLKICHNSKIARAEITLIERAGPVTTLTSDRAALEILLDEPRVPVAV